MLYHRSGHSSQPWYGVLNVPAENRQKPILAAKLILSIRVGLVLKPNQKDTGVGDGFRKDGHPWVCHMGKPKKKSDAAARGSWFPVLHFLSSGTSKALGLDVEVVNYHFGWFYFVWAIHSGLKRIFSGKPKVRTFLLGP